MTYVIQQSRQQPLRAYFSNIYVLWLKIISLGRNLIKNLHGIESAGDTLEQLWISYNQIDRLKPIRSLQKLKVRWIEGNTKLKAVNIVHLEHFNQKSVYSGVSNKLTRPKMRDTVLHRPLLLESLFSGLRVVLFQ